MLQDNSPKIRVVIRKRPINKKELLKGDTDIIKVENPLVTVQETKVKVDLTKYIESHKFNMDYAFGEECSNQQVYCDIVRPLVDAAFNKAKVTCFAYGQTGSGKTHTMMGDPGSETREPVPGMYLLAAQDIFNLLRLPEFQNLNIFVSFYEIYCGKLFDLLNNRSLLTVREDGKQNVNIVGLQEQQVKDINTLMQLISFGMTVRVTNMTGANDDSSRSHAILQIQLKEGKKTFGKLTFIDLAGSERAADVTDQNKQTRIDGAEINKSLLALKECIRALDQNNGHLPFRGSKLTLVLKDSFIGNCKTVMIGNISAASGCCENTLNTLRYADRVKELKKGPQKNENLSQQDLLAKQLMLPRMNRNSTKKLVTDQENEPKVKNQLKKQPSARVPWQDIDTDQLYENQPYPFQNKNQMMNLPPHNYQRQNSDFNPLLQKQMSAENQNYFNNYNQLQDYMPQQQIPQPQQHMNHFIMPQQNQPMEIDDDLLLGDISNNHEKLIQIILNEEEQLIQMHRNHIDNVVDITKQDMQLLHKIDQPGSDVDEYLQNLEDLLNKQIYQAQELKSKLLLFKSHLKEEEQLSNMFYEKKQQHQMEIFQQEQQLIQFNANQMKNEFNF